jgi:hypothetical protein
MPFVSRTRAILRKAEFGFFGVIVLTMTQTPRFCGDLVSRRTTFFRVLKLMPNAGALVRLGRFRRPFLTN